MQRGAAQGVGNGEKVKTCNRCKVDKPVEMFYKRKDSLDGYRKECKHCKKVSVMNYQKESALYKEYRCVYMGTRRKRFRQATPLWLTKSHMEYIERIYKAARDLRWEDEMHVDHIIPLNGKDVCGLHVPWNLQLLTKEENLRKGNKYECGKI